MKNVLMLLVLSLSLLACGQQTTQVADSSRVLAQMGDFNLTEQYLQAYLKQTGVQQPDQAQLDQAMDELIAQQALAQQASKSGLELSAEQAYVIEQAKTRALAQLAIKQYLQEHPVEDAELQAEYDRIVAEIKGAEYRVRHMLFQDEVQALTVLEQITGGADYATLEADYLNSRPHVKNVGDIGWVNIMQVPEAFRAPLQQLSAGQTHQQVVISQFGAHVLHLADSRTATPPAFDEVKAGIRKTLEQQKIDRYRQLAVVKAKVKVTP